MTESEELRVQAEAPDGVGGRTVESVTDNGMSRLGEMGADLILPPRLQRHFEHRKLRRCADGPIVRHSALGVGARPLDAGHAQILHLHQMRFNCSRWWIELSLDDRNVDAIDVMLGELILQRFASREML